MECIMGKRSDFVRNERDYYQTPLKAIEPLVTHLPDTFTFAEPCAGDGRLIQHIAKLTNNGGVATFMCDVDPQEDWIMVGDALEAVIPETVDYIITNPPWDRKLLHPLIERFAMIKPTWLLFDADWMHTMQSIPYMPWCEKIVSVGRVKWIEGSTSVGKDNAAWYLFDANHIGETAFYGRT
jgi:hypothetical protein